MADLVSIIVPVFNVINYLPACVESILSQTYGDFECILVDDGSTDGSGALCDLLTETDDRIRVIHRENGGLSAARNTGLDVARGQYIAFIDSDDLVGAHYLEVLLSGIQSTGAQIAACRYRRFPDGQSYGEERYTYNTVVWSQEEALSELSQPGAEHRAEYVSVMWNKLYCRALFENLRFPEGKLHEDEFLVHHLLLQTEKICCCDAELHFYRQRENSITGSENVMDLRHLQVLDAYMERCELLKGRTERWVYRKTVTRYFETMIYNYFTLAKPAGCGQDLYRRYLRELARFGKEMRVKRYFLFALSPQIYYKKFW